MRLESEAGDLPGLGHREFVISPLVLTAAIGGGPHQLCFTHDEREAQRGEVTYPRIPGPISVESWDSE